MQETILTNSTLKVNKAKSILCYFSFPIDSNTHMFEERSETRLKFSNVYELGRINPKYKLGRIRKDFLATYDGYYIVSQKFHDFCKREKYEHLEFIELPNNPNFYWFKVHSILPFDTERRGTRFLNYSAEFNGFEEIIGATPVYLKIDEPITEGIFRTNVCFGTGISKSPVICFGIITKEKIQKEGLTGFYFEKVYL
jgi:hypothetical protein